MEIGICVIDMDSLVMEFSGVGIPLRLMKKGAKEISIYKTPRYMVGGIDGDEQEVNAKLKKEKVQLEPGDKVYLASDGFQDQFGGENDKKFMSKNFNRLLQDTSSEPMSKQENILEATFKDWSKNTPQTDDIMILGFEAR